MRLESTLAMRIFNPKNEEKQSRDFLSAFELLCGWNLPFVDYKRLAKKGFVSAEFLDKARQCFVTTAGVAVEAHKMIEKLESKVDRGGKEIKQLDDASKPIDDSSAIEDLNKQVNKQSKRISKLENALPSLDKNSTNVNSSQGNARASDKIIGKLTKRISSLEDEIKSLKSSKGLTGIPGEKGEKGDKGDPGGVDSDVITGLKSSISTLEKAVKLDPKLPSSNKDAGINYYINRNYEDIKSNYSQIDSVYDRLFRIEGSIDPTTDWSQDNNIDLMATIKSLTARVDALEA